MLRHTAKAIITLSHYKNLEQTEPNITHQFNTKRNMSWKTYSRLTWRTDTDCCIWPSNRNKIQRI